MNFGAIKMDEIRNLHIRGSTKISPVTDKLSSNKLAWYKNNEEKKISCKEMDRCKSNERPKNVRMVFDQ